MRCDNHVDLRFKNDSHLSSIFNIFFDIINDTADKYVTTRHQRLLYYVHANVEKNRVHIANVFKIRDNDIIAGSELFFFFFFLIIVFPPRCGIEFLLRRISTVRYYYNVPLLKTIRVYIAYTSSFSRL